MVHVTPGGGVDAAGGAQPGNGLACSAGGTRHARARTRNSRKDPLKHVPLQTVIAALLLSSACATPYASTAAGANADAEPRHAPGQTAAAPPSPAAAHELPATAGRRHTVADVRFMQHMIAHHAQALVMTAMVPTHGAGEQLRQLAEKIDISQKDEIAAMRRWLEERRQVVPNESHLHGMHMPGMLSDEQLAQLNAARGAEFERLFLTFMIQHHRGALEMVEALFDTPGAGQDSDLFRFATDVDADQRDEIYAMQSMLTMLDTQRGS